MKRVHIVALFCGTLVEILLGSAFVIQNRVIEFVEKVK